MEKILAIDFDGTIHDFKNPKPGRRMGDVIVGAKEAIIKLKSKGYKIIIHTVFSGDDRERKVVEDYLNYYGIPFHEVTNQKPRADLYIDDHGLFFQNWDDTLSEIYKRII